MRNVGVTLAMVALLGGCDRSPAPEKAPPTTGEKARTALEAGARFLRSQQKPDGSFRSQAYAAFRDGYSLTPLAVLALRTGAGKRGQGVQRALSFLAGLSRPEAHATYEHYAVAGALLALNLEPNKHAAAHAKLLERLKARQLDERFGFTPDDADYGGFNYAKQPAAKDAANPEGRADPANLSATVFAVGALRLSGVEAADPVLQRARTFVERCQRFGPEQSGGFFFGPSAGDGNKAATDASGKFRAYGSMTSDGLRALLQLGAGPGSPRVKVAGSWLERHFDAERNPGDFPAVAEVRRQSSYYYYAWSVAHALRAWGRPILQTPRGPVRWAERLAAALIDRQRPDGSWRNEASEVREDDPLVATPFAMAALAVCEMQLSGRPRSHHR